MPGLVRTGPAPNGPVDVVAVGVDSCGRDGTPPRRAPRDDGVEDSVPDPEADAEEPAEPEVSAAAIVGNHTTGPTPKANARAPIRPT